MQWWVPLAIIGAILVGIGFALAVAAPRRVAGLAAPPVPAATHRGTRYDRDNRVGWNPAAFAVVLALLGGISALAVALALT